MYKRQLLLFVAGTLVGTLTGFVLAWTLVKLLTGAFDPPPERLSVPWFYLGGLIGIALVSVGIAVVGALRETKVPAVQRMREI